MTKRIKAFFRKKVLTSYKRSAINTRKQKVKCSEQNSLSKMFALQRVIGWCEMICDFG